MLQITRALRDTERTDRALVLTARLYTVLLESMLLSLYGDGGCEVVLCKCQQFNQFFDERVRGMVTAHQSLELERNESCETEKIQRKRQEMNMSRNNSTGSLLTFLVGIGVGAAAVILMGSKRVDELHDEVSEVLNDGLDQFRSKTKDIRRQAEKTVNAAQQKVQEAINAGADAYSDAKRS
jgi:gas vesicle protein